MTRLLGTPPIAPYTYLLGKASLLLCWVSLLVRPWWPRLVWLRRPALEVTGAVALAAGAALVLAGILNLGAAVRMGLPTERTALKTQGLYRYTRNPMYVGGHLMCLAAVLWTMNPVLVFLAAVVVVVHHKIILAEERYLTAEFGDEYREYATRVPRYL